jgi:hypothetical protein
MRPEDEGSVLEILLKEGNRQEKKLYRMLQKKDYTSKSSIHFVLPHTFTEGTYPSCEIVGSGFSRFVLVRLF